MWVPKVVFHTHIALTLQGKVTQGGGQDRGGTVFLTTRAAKPSTSECLHYLLYTKKKSSKAGRKQNLSALFLERKGSHDMVKDLSLPIPARLSKQDLE